MMKRSLENILKSLLIIFILIIISSLLINILYYFDVINNNIVKYFELILLLLSFFMGGFCIGKKSLNKGYLNGIKLSLIVIIILLLLSIIFNNLSISKIIYYLIMTFTITIGSMIGINKKINN